jgi:hypothetical protein
LKRDYLPRQMWLLLFALLLAATVDAATSARRLQLADVLEAALARQPVGAAKVPFQASAWLAALPSIDVSYLGSDARLGTDETELGLNLPVKSPYLHQQDRHLREIAEQLVEAERDRRRLYYSGLIREAMWTARIEQARADLTERRLGMLEQLLQREQALLQARGTSRYNLLLVRQELVDARLALEDQQAEQRQWLERYRALTGLSTLPENLEEAALPDGNTPVQHPVLRLLDLLWEQQQALIAAGSERAAPWNLRLGAKQLDGPGVEETQYGLAVEIPLGISGIGDQASSNDWREAARSHWQQRDEWQLTLQHSRQQLELEHGHLQRRQALLEEAAAVSTELGQQADSLRDLNELGRERWLQRQIDDLDRQAAATINTLLVGQNRAMRLQAAGIPL